jgi:hypothetical protein
MTTFQVPVEETGRVQTSDLFADSDGQSWRKRDFPVELKSVRFGSWKLLNGWKFGSHDDALFVYQLSLGAQSRENLGAQNTLLTENPGEAH